VELLIIILNKEKYFETLISILTEAGVNNATISNSEGIGHFLAYEVPIFAGLRQLVGEGKSMNKTILAVLNNNDIFCKFKKLLLEEDIDFTKPGVGVMITLPVNEIIKSNEEI